MYKTISVSLWQKILQNAFSYHTAQLERQKVLEKKTCNKALSIHHMVILISTTIFAQIPWQVSNVTAVTITSIIILKESY